MNLISTEELLENITKDIKVTSKLVKDREVIKLIRNGYGKRLRRGKRGIENGK